MHHDAWYIQVGFIVLVYTAFSGSASVAPNFEWQFRLSSGQQPAIGMQMEWAVYPFEVYSFIRQWRFGGGYVHTADIVWMLSETTVCNNGNGRMSSWSRISIISTISEQPCLQHRLQNLRDISWHGTLSFRFGIAFSMHAAYFHTGTDLHRAPPHNFHQASYQYNSACTVLLQPLHTTQRNWQVIVLWSTTTQTSRHGHDLDVRAQVSSEL